MDRWREAMLCMHALWGAQGVVVASFRCAALPRLRFKLCLPVPSKPLSNDDDNNNNSDDDDDDDDEMS